MPAKLPEPPARKRGGKPAYVPTDKDRRTVAAMTGVGISQDELCGVLGISVPTLHKYYRRELNTSWTQVVTRMRVKLIAKADAGDTLALIHVNKVMGWNDRLVVVDGGSEVDPSTLSDAEIAKRVAALQRKPGVARAAKAAGTVH